ncbi:hypothetical protein ACJMK2_034616 [Sinanodonta woodiana]|uniref:Uncharacterized protein n=1 Tax=Sinanodonta woodiana TaxID=1069815 RepID=A0ABD3WW11_SINWO
MEAKENKPLYFNCHENPCLWGYQYCDRVIRRCLACDVVSSMCHTPSQPFNCTLYCYDITRSGETSTLERCDDGHHLLYLSIGINVLFALLFVIFVCLLRYEIRVAVKYFFGKILYRNHRPDGHVRPQHGENVKSNESETELRIQHPDINEDVSGIIERSEDSSRLNYEREERAESQHQQRQQRPNMPKQHNTSAAGTVRGELQSRLSAGNSHTHACLPPGRRIHPATADTGYNSGNVINHPF